MLVTFDDFCFTTLHNRCIHCRLALFVSFYFSKNYFTCDVVIHYLSDFEELKTECCWLLNIVVCSVCLYFFQGCGVVNEVLCDTNSYYIVCIQFNSKKIRQIFWKIIELFLNYCLFWSRLIFPLFLNPSNLGWIFFLRALFLQWLMFNFLESLRPVLTNSVLFSLALIFF